MTAGAVEELSTLAVMATTGQLMAATTPVMAVTGRFMSLAILTLWYFNFMAF